MSLSGERPFLTVCSILAVSLGPAVLCASIPACSGNPQKDARTAADIQRVVCGFLETEARAGRIDVIAPEVEAICPGAAAVIRDVGAGGGP